MNTIKLNTTNIGCNMHDVALDIYTSIKDNPYIPKDIKESWVDFCVITSDVKDLTNY